MTLQAPPAYWDIHQVNAARVEVIGAFGFTERGAVFEAARCLEAGESIKNFSSSAAEACPTEREDLNENRANVLDELEKKTGVSDGI